MRVLLLPILLLASTTLLAQPVTRYITDQLEVTLRSGESNQHRIISMLASGTRVEVLEDNSESGYSRIRTPGDVTGWVLSRYLESTPGARERLAGAERELAQRRDTITELREQNRQLSGQNAELRERAEKLQRTNQEIDQEITRIRRTSASALALDDENKTLREQLNHLQREQQVLQQQNQALQDRTARDWFIVGAGVVLLGIVIGLIIPKIRWQRKSQWNRF